MSIWTQIVKTPKVRVIPQSISVGKLNVYEDLPFGCMLMSFVDCGGNNSIRFNCVGDGD